MNIFAYKIQWSMILIAGMIVTSCFEKDERVQPHPDTGNIFTIEDRVLYYQSYFDFETGKVISVSPNNSWQLGFECTPEGWHIITNSGASWFIYNTRQKELNSGIDIPVDLTGLYDLQRTYPDSTAVGRWLTGPSGERDYTKNVYLLGKLAGAKYDHVSELVFLEVTDTNYQFFYKNDEVLDTVTILKNDSVNFVYFDILSGEQVNFEPAKEKYDLVFCSYYDTATNFNINLPYLVGGALMNTRETSCFLDSINSYDAIEYKMISSYDFRFQRDLPGYNWKRVHVDVNSGSATYSTRMDLTYIFHTPEDHFFKMRFLTYTMDGITGHPGFEFNELIDTP